MNFPRDPISSNRLWSVMSGIHIFRQLKHPLLFGEPVGKT